MLFIKKRLEGDENSILIDHSTGAVATLRYLEKNKCRLVILVSCYYTDLDDKMKKKWLF
ncbi:MAG: hypothetical protein U5L76_01325 [Patescibacteria group bacterium]|nr:hypothetical protein [Patescibacteria group bacterium]